VKKLLKIVMLVIILLCITFSVINIVLFAKGGPDTNPESFNGTVVETDDGTTCSGAPLNC
jgi:hypothetical protein